DYRLGELMIDHPWTRTPPPGAAVAAGYLEIRNDGAEADRLIAAEFEASDRVEIHEMSVVDDVMRMNEIPGGLVIPAGEPVMWEPGGLHLMFMGLTQPIAAGGAVAGTLTFEKAGSIDVDFTVTAMGEGGHGHGAHQMGHAGHGEPMAKPAAVDAGHGGHGGHHGHGHGHSHGHGK
ncbi:MAG: copper chaperone PCu(A)C, partial [Pseudomonadota bacterium]